MLFNSFEFLFCFLPVTVAGFFLIASRGYRRGAVVWLVVASLFFYAWWNPRYLVLIGASIGFNFIIGRALAARAGGPRAATPMLTAGIAGNLLLLGYFKYANFAIDNAGLVFGHAINFAPVVLPLAISFFTFQQIAFLVDARRGEAHEYSFLHYCLFVTFFPQLIAGPIVHHKEMMPQFVRDATYRPDVARIAAGVSLIVVGLFKKVVIADSCALFVDPVFAAAEAGASVTFFESWGAALAYTLQIYFDFSGYVDIAIGAARLFGIDLPMNFNSPYKARSISEFWRRWHMTLSRFLRDYLYIPLGGNRAGGTRRYINLMIVMLLGGLWHGAGWTFVFWGFLHGLYLVVNHGWRYVVRRVRLPNVPPSVSAGASWALTFVVVVIAWVFFRAESFAGAWGLVGSMVGHGFGNLPDVLAGRIGAFEGYLMANGVSFDARLVIEPRVWLIGIPTIVLGTLIALALPNSNELFDPRRRDRVLAWRPGSASLAIIFVMFMLVVVNLFRVSPFLYFNF